MRSTRFTAAGAFTAAVVLGLAGTATAHGGDDDGETIRIQDDCDQVTFNAILGPEGCVGDGDTTFDELFEALVEDGEHGKWRFHPDETHLDHGEALHAHNEGGEFHTFTPVAHFGGPGCVPEINAVLGLGPPPATCGADIAASAVPAGATIHLGHLDPGVHKFVCLIHPWMRTVVEVEDD